MHDNFFLKKKQKKKSSINILKSIRLLIFFWWIHQNAYYYKKKKKLDMSFLYVIGNCHGMMGEDSVSLTLIIVSIYLYICFWKGEGNILFHL